MAKDKLSAAMHFLIANVEPSQLGATKLNKILWFADCELYRRHGRTITGETEYVRRQNGPCVPFARFDSAMKRLKAEHAISEELVHAYVGDRREFRSHTPPDLRVFTEEEVEVLRGVAEEISRLTAFEASDLSHDALWEETTHG